MGRKKEGNTVIVSVRMPQKLVEAIEDTTKGKGITKNAFMVSCLQACLCLHFTDNKKITEEAKKRMERNPFLKK